MKNEELREVQTFKAVPNKKTQKWIVFAMFRNGRTRIVAGGLDSRSEAQEYLKLLVEDIKMLPE